MTPKQPSEQAVRCAMAVAAHWKGIATTRDISEIIDRETDLPRLLAVEKAAMELLRVAEGLAEQQAMPDDFYKPALENLCTLLDEASQ